MLNPHTTVDPDGLLEYSAVYTDRSLNHMSQSFKGVMKDISATLKKVYNANGVIIIPGGGTFAMEAVARQFATDRKCLVIRNGLFSFRWSQIFDMGDIPSESTVLQAFPVDNSKHAAFAPAPIEKVVAAIETKKPEVVFVPHVETSSGIMVPDDYIRAIADAVHSVDGILVLDCIASGTIWIDMEKCGVDVLISAPQKGWSSSPCSGLVMLSPHAEEMIESSTSTSFACDLLRWKKVMEAYENDGHAYHATMPTDALRRFRDTMKETEEYGFDKVRSAQLELARNVSDLLVSKDVKIVAAEGFQAPGIIVCYTEDADIQNGNKFSGVGIQIAAGAPLHCDEPEDFKTFRLGLFGLDKLQNVDRTVARLDEGLSKILG